VPRYRERVADSLTPVTPGSLTRLLLRPLAALTLALAVPLAYAGAASADVPEGWSKQPDPPVSFLHALLVLGGIPLLVIVLLALAVYLPSIVRGESVAPAGARTGDEWFGGRRDAGVAIEARRGVADDTGGASGHW
jgi:hypothetical protein